MALMEQKLPGQDGDQSHPTMSDRKWGTIYPPNAHWLSLQKTEDILEPALAIIDTHFHIKDTAERLYLAPDFLADIQSGHNVRGAVLAEANTNWLEAGPEALRPVGETAFVAPMVDAEGSPLAAGIVGYADLNLGSEVVKTLEAHVAAGLGRFRGVRYSTAADSSSEIASHTRAPADVMKSARFNNGLKVLERLGLSYDAWVFFHQLPDLIKVVDAHPGLNIVLGHCGGPLGYGPYAGQMDRVFALWLGYMKELALRPNVTVKIGGLLMRSASGNYLNCSIPASSTVFAHAIKPFVEATVDAFGPNRCMFESNFPVDKMFTGYVPLVNAYKIITANLSASEKEAIYFATAARIYKLNLVYPN